MSMIRRGVCWPAFGILAVAGTAWFIADEGGFHPHLSAAAIAQANPPTSRANALTASLTDERRLKGKSVKSYSTRFQLNEDPISESGRWINCQQDANDWYNESDKALILNVSNQLLARRAVHRGFLVFPFSEMIPSWRAFLLYAGERLSVYHPQSREAKP